MTFLNTFWGKFPVCGKLSAQSVVCVAFLAMLALTFSQNANADIFTVTGIDIAATAKTATDAKQIAIAGGQKKALVELLDKLTSAEEAASLPPADAAMLQQVIVGFSLEDERTGPTQYLAKLTVRFHPDAIELWLAQNGIKISIVQSPQTLIVPVLWNNSKLSVLNGVDAWTETLRRIGLQDRLVPLLQTLGDATDASVDREAVVAADETALQLLMDRYAVEYAVVATAVYAPDNAVLSGTVAGPGPAGNVNIQKQVDVVPGEEGKAFRELALALLDALDEDWRLSAEGSAGANTEDFAFVVPFRELSEWVIVRERLETMQGINSLDVQALGAGSASVVVKYNGDLSAFLNALDVIGFAMFDTGERWELGAR